MFIGILLIVIVQNPLIPFSQGGVARIENSGEAARRMSVKGGQALKRYESSGEIGEGQGTRAGDLPPRGWGGSMCPS